VAGSSERSGGCVTSGAAGTRAAKCGRGQRALGQLRWSGAAGGCLWPGAAGDRTAAVVGSGVRSVAACYREWRTLSWLREERSGGHSRGFVRRREERTLERLHVVGSGRRSGGCV